MYYWTIVNRETGEVYEKNRGYSSEEGAYQAALAFARRNVDYGDLLIEIWSFSDAYSAPQHVLPMSSKRYKKENVFVNLEHLDEILGDLDVSYDEGCKIKDNIWRDREFGQWRQVRDA